MGKAKELAELGDKLTVTGSAVTVSGFNYDNIVDSAPGALDTLNELAAALGDDANFSTTVTNSIATKLPLTGGTLTGDLTITSGTSGDATLTIIADTDNNNEFDNPKILFIQDGGYEAGGVQLSNNDTIVWNGIGGAGGPGNGQGGITFRTGTSPGAANATTKMYIEPSGKVGIGTTSPQGILHLDEGASDDCLLICETHAGGDSMILWTQGNSGPAWAMGLDASSGTNDGLSIAYKSNGFPSLTSQSLVVIDTSGNVGIGTTSPSAGLHIDNPNDSQITAILDTDNSAVKIVFRNNTETGNNVQIGADGSSLVALTNATERMRIDSNGIVMIGRTTSSSSTAGAQFSADGNNIVRDGQSALTVKRLTSNGDIITLAKDGDVVGTIGGIKTSSGGRTYLSGSTTHSIYVNGGSANVNPGTATGSDNDNAVDLGASYARWKDLYLSNRLKLGASGGIEFGHATSSASGVSANSTLLDHYEEGSFTPVLSWYTPSNGSVTYQARTAYYIRVGRAVTIHLEMRLNFVSQNSATLPLLVSGFPFPFRNTGGYGGSLMQVSLQGFTFSSGHIPFGWGEYNSDRMFLLTMSSGNLNSNLATPANYKTINVSGTYITPQ